MQATDTAKDVSTAAAFCIYRDVSDANLLKSRSVAGALRCPDGRVLGPTGDVRGECVSDDVSSSTFGRSDCVAIRDPRFDTANADADGPNHAHCLKDSSPADSTATNVNNNSLPRGDYINEQIPSCARQPGWLLLADKSAG